jgi:hypothetical protein
MQGVFVSERLFFVSVIEPVMEKISAYEIGSYSPFLFAGKIKITFI